MDLDRQIARSDGLESCHVTGSSTNLHLPLSSPAAVPVGLAAPPPPASRRLQPGRTLLLLPRALLPSPLLPLLSPRSPPSSRRNSKPPPRHGDAPSSKHPAAPWSTVRRRSDRIQQRP